MTARPNDNYTVTDKASVFVGSTGERAEIADAIVQQLSAIAEVTHWEDAYPPGISIYDTLMSIKDNFDFAVFVLTADDFLQSRGESYQSPRDNVVFELGLFLGSIGPGRVFAVIDENVKTKLPTDLSGVVYEKYNPNRKDGNISSALRVACFTIREQINRLGPKERFSSEAKTDGGFSAIGIEKIYNSYIECESDLFKSFRKTQGPVRLLLYVASQNVGIKGPILDLIEEISRQGVEVRILHASLNSPTFSKERLVNIGKDYDRIRNTIEYVGAELSKLQDNDLPVLRRGHDLPFIWRMYAFPEHVYVMPYFAEKDAVTTSPVIKFSNSDRSMYAGCIEFFEHLWSASSPRKISLSELLTKSTQTSTALLLNWNGRHVFGIPKRDVASGSSQLRFYGLGGKREAEDESLVACALREGNEESGGAIGAIIGSKSTKLSRYNGSIEEIEVDGNETKPVIIIEKQRFRGAQPLRGQTPDRLIYTFCYFAELKKKPMPDREIAAIIIMDDAHLKTFRRTAYTTLSDLEELGVEIIEAADITLDRDSIMVPHGTANYLMNM